VGDGTIADLMTSEVLTVAPEDTVGEAAEKMVARGVGSVLVSDYGRLIGILTERDLLRAVADRIHTSEARVREWMTAEPITVSPTTPAEEAARTMLERGFRHLPVVENERTIGIVSLRDVLDWSLNQSR
jgi:CBS domain-containing protein